MACEHAVTPGAFLDDGTICSLCGARWTVNTEITESELPDLHIGCTDGWREFPYRWYYVRHTGHSAVHHRDHNSPWCGVCGFGFFGLIPIEPRLGFWDSSESKELAKDAHCTDHSMVTHLVGFNGDQVVGPICSKCGYRETVERETPREVPTGSVVTDLNLGRFN